MTKAVEISLNRLRSKGLRVVLKAKGNQYMTIVHLSSERAKRERPDADCVGKDSAGQELNLFSIEYRIGAKTFSFEIWATSFEQAEAHVEAIRGSAVLAGRIKAQGNI